MRSRAAIWRLAPAVAVLLFVASPALAIELHSIQFPERRSVDVSFTGLKGAPRATLSASVRYEGGQAQIELEYDEMKPAILFGGDITCYVLWAVTRDGVAENLGELIVDDDRGEYDFSTGKKAFALIVTAEPYYLVSKPSELLMFFNKKSADRRAQSTPFSFTGFVLDAKPALDSIANIAWEDDTPLVLLQARNAVDLARRRKADDLAPQFMEDAVKALDEANKYAVQSPKSRRVVDTARRSVALSNEAMNIATYRQEGLELERQIAERRAQMEQLEARVAEATSRAEQASARAEQARAEAETANQEAAELRRQSTDLRRAAREMNEQMAALQIQKSDLESNLVEMRAEQERLEARAEQLANEKTALSNRLQSALSQVADTRESARGLVVNLPDILFDVGKATLKSETQVIIAKVAGILLVMPDLSVTIEGHTDSTGSAEFNQRLSEQRAESVVQFLADNGIDPQRLRSAGFGMDQPLADNATAEGRRKNRRVEIIISDSQN